MTFDCAQHPFTVMLDQLTAPKQRRAGSQTRMRFGDRYGQWTVIDYIPGRTHQGRKLNAIAICRCDCGTEREVAASALYAGASRSCGHEGRGRPARKVYSKETT